MEGAASDSGGSSSSSSEATSAYTSHRSEPYGSGSDRAKQQQPKILPTSSSKGSQNAQQHSPAKKEEDVRRGIEQMREALEMIPAEQKKAYTEAMRRAPRLVEIESAFERCVPCAYPLDISSL